MGKIKKSAKTKMAEDISRVIFYLRGQRVILDSDLACLYGVSTKRLKEQVRRNRERFPSDFMYRLTVKETVILRSQFATSSWGGTRYCPFAFTEQGVAMLSSVLNSRRAILMNIRIMRAFVRFKGFLHLHQEIAERLKKLERKSGQHDREINVLLDTMRQLMQSPEPPKRRIGFCP